MQGCLGSAAMGVKMPISSPTPVTLMPQDLRTVVTLRDRKVARRT